MNTGKELFFRNHIILGRKFRLLAKVRREIQKIPILCRNQSNGIFRIYLILGTEARHPRTILGENFFFSDHLILETKFNENSLTGAANFEKFQKCAAIKKRLKNTGLDLALDERFY